MKEKLVAETKKNETSHAQRKKIDQRTEKKKQNLI